LERATDNVTLTGSAVLADPLTRTTARSVSFNQHTGEVRAEGDVRSSSLPAGRNAITTFAPQPAHISSDRLLANSTNGRAVYSGHARLWQGDAVIEADSIELVRDARLLTARGNVLAVFPQAPGSPIRTPVPTGAEGAEPDLWRVRAGTLTYWSSQARAQLEQNVSAQSRYGLISSQTLELFFSSAEGRAQQLTRALASGNVSVRQGERRGTAERAEYAAAEGKFILSGGHPALYDASRGTTTGRQLTFFFADDRIVVDSEEGSRTLTRHRVEK
jgi:lipopolysaccharide export system protein LptA